MKLLVLADDDDIRHDLTAQPADLVVSIGDVADLVILEAAKLAQCPRIFAVKGNHDGGGPFPPPIVDLHLVVQTVNGVRFGGFNGSWRYKPVGHYHKGSRRAKRDAGRLPRRIERRNGPRPGDSRAGGAPGLRDYAARELWREAIIACLKGWVRCPVETASWSRWQG